MKRLSFIIMLLILFASCKKNIKEDMPPGQPSDENKVAAARTIYPIPSHMWASMPVPTTIGDDPNNPIGNNKIIQVNGEVLCLIGQLFRTVYKLNKITREWEFLEDDIFYTSFGTGTQYFFSYQSKIYYGMNTGPDSTDRKFYSRDIITKVKTTLAPFPGTPVSGAASFVIGDKGYIASGLDRETNTSVNQLWEYNFSTNQWTNKGSSPLGSRTGASVLVVENKVYLGLGKRIYKLNGQSIQQHINDWKVYYPASGFSVTMASFPGLKRSYAKGFVINREPYVGFGINGSSYFKDFWKFDVSSNAWVQQTNWPGNDITGVSNLNTFSFENAGYVVKGALSEFWGFNVSQSIP